MSEAPTKEEQTEFSIRAFRGVEVGLGQADPTAAIAAKLEAQHPGHLVLVQAGKFLHGFDRLTRSSDLLHNHFAVETSAVGIGVPVIGGQPPLSGFLSSVAWQAQWAGRAGQRKLRRSYPGTPTRTVPLTRLASGKRNDKTLDRSSSMRLKFDHTGQRFGRLLVISKQGEKWLCRCDCGTEKPISGGHLRSGNVVSCGCYIKEIAKNPKTHGATYTRASKIWVSMNQRCNNPKNSRYSDYGGRGIKVCDRWLKLENFIADMGQPPAGMTLDRINNDLGYEPSNCRWATSIQQARNTSANRLVTINGITKTLAEWCEIYDLKYQTAHSRIRKGWSEEEAITTPAMRAGAKRHRAMFGHTGATR